MSHHPSFGTELKMDPVGGTVYIAVGQVKDISGPALTRGDIDVTDHDSASGYREFIPGLVDGGVVSFPIGWDSQNLKHLQGVGTGLLGDMEQTCTLAAWELTLTQCAGTAAVWTFDGYVNNFAMTSAVEGEQMADVAIKISGKPTLTIT